MDYPLWVRAALAGLHDRAVAVAAAVTYVVVAAICAAYAVRSGSTLWYGGLLLLGPAALCRLGIRWADRYGRWP